MAAVRGQKVNEELGVSSLSLAQELNKRIMRMVRRVRDQHEIEIKTKDRELFKTHEEIRGFADSDLAEYIINLRDVVFKLYDELRVKNIVPESRTMQGLQSKKETVQELQDPARARELLTNLISAMKKINKKLNSWSDRKVTALAEELRELKQEVLELKQLLENKMQTESKAKGLSSSRMFRKL